MKETFPIELKQIEHIKAHRRFAALHFQRLEQLKRGAAFLVECDYFAIDHAFVDRQFFDCIGNFAKATAQFISVTRSEIDLAVVFDGARADAIELQLVTPIAA